MLHRAGALWRSGRRLVLGPRGRSLLGDSMAQWALAATTLIDSADFDGTAQEAAVLLLLRADGMVEVQELVREVVQVLASSGWRDAGDGSPPGRSCRRPSRVGPVRRCELWSIVEEGRGPGYATRLRLSEIGRRAGFVALRTRALRPRIDYE